MCMSFSHERKTQRIAMFEIPGAAFTKVHNVHVDFPLLFHVSQGEV